MKMILWNSEGNHQMVAIRGKTMKIVMMGRIQYR